MSQKTLGIWLRGVVIAAALCGAEVYGQLLPAAFRLTGQSGGWLALMELTALPIYAALVLTWLIFRNIGRDRSFILPNAAYLKWIAVLAAADTLYLFVCASAYCIRTDAPLEVLLAALIACMLGAAAAVACAALSHLVAKAAALQEQSDLTI